MTKTTTQKHYDTDLTSAKEEAYEMLLQMGSTAYPSPHNPSDIDDQISKSLDDALNNEWAPGISIARWAELALGSMGLLTRSVGR